MRYKNFLLRTVNLLLIAAVLFGYQQTALTRAAAVAQRQQEIDEVNAYNTTVLAAQAEAEAASETEGGYADGTYEGTALGFGDDITVQITLLGGQLTDITVLDASGEDKPYYNQAKAVLDEILATQSTEVDTVSGATLTAEGLINAVADALGKAAK